MKRGASPAQGGARRAAAEGILWSSAERFSVQGIQYVVMIVMARLLTPADYGLVGMLSVFVAVSQSLVDSGFSQALIRKRDRTEADNSTVFYFNIAVGVSLYLVLYACAPWVSRFYALPALCPVMRAVSLGVVFNSLAVVQRTLLTVEVDFRTQAKASLVAACVSGAAGISLACAGYGAWALVWQQLAGLGTNTALLWLFSGWKPSRAFSRKSFGELFSFGSRLLASGLLDTLYRNIQPIVIGKAFSAADLGHFSRAHQFSSFPSSNLTGVMQRVTYPVLCGMQDDAARLRDAYRKFLRLSAFVVFPLMAGLSAVSFPLVRVFLGERWAPCAGLLRILCFSMMWYPVHAINLNLLQVRGRSDLFLRLEVVKKAAGAAMLCVTVPMGLKAMCYGEIAMSLLCLAVNTHYTGKLIRVGFMAQMRDLLPTLAASLLTFAAVLAFVRVAGAAWWQLAGGTLAGAATYLAVARAFRFRELGELASMWPGRARAGSGAGRA